jgi:hypothetical protein
MANEHVFRQSLIITGSVTSSVGFSGDGSGLTGITAVAEWDGSRNGDASITGSLIVSGSGVNVDFTNTTGVSGSFSGSFAGFHTGSFAGDGTNLTGVTATLPAGVVSGSAQISYTGITDVPSGIVSSSAQFNSLTDPFSGSFTGSFTGDGSGLTDLTLPAGTVSGSAQITYSGITDVPANIVSSSAQFTTLTNPFTGSFTGSFTGDGSGLTGITATATGGIFQTGSNTGAIKTNDTSYTSIASGQFSFAGGGRYVTASADYATALGGFQSKATETYATVVGGQTNEASGVGSLAGGIDNVASGSYTAAVGGRQHDVLATDASAFGGRGHQVTGGAAIGAGGYSHTVSGLASVVIGGDTNSATGPYSNVFGGCLNVASTTGSVILGGSNQTTTRDNVVVVNNLFATGSGTADTSTFTGVIQLANRTSTPASGVEGMLMVSASVLYFYGESGWVQIS